MISNHLEVNTKMAVLKRTNQAIDVTIEAGTKFMGGGLATWATHLFTEGLAKAPDVQNFLGNGDFGKAIQLGIEYGLPAYVAYKELN